MQMSARTERADGVETRGQSKDHEFSVSRATLYISYQPKAKGRTRSPSASSFLSLPAGESVRSRTSNYDFVGRLRELLLHLRGARQSLGFAPVLKRGMEKGRRMNGRCMKGGENCGKAGAFRRRDVGQW